jgi:nucleoside-diphosphate-sugar epimerase
LAIADLDTLNSYHGRRVLITGARGFIGRWVARTLTSAGAVLWATAHEAVPPAAFCDRWQIRCEWRAIDLAVPSAFTCLYAEVHPDVVFNLAGYGVPANQRDEAMARALNTDLVQEIAEAVASDASSGWPGLRMVHVGSAAEYGPVSGAVTESSPTVPVTMYGRTKLAGTQAVSEVRRRARLRAITARLFTVYGPGESSPRLLPSLIETAKSGAELSLTDGQQQRDFTYVADVAEGLLRLGALTGDVPEVVNLARGQLTSVRAFTECAGELLALRSSQLRFGALPRRDDEAQHGRVDISSLRRLLAWVPPSSVREGIRQTVEFEVHTSPGKPQPSAVNSVPGGP